MIREAIILAGGLGTRLRSAVPDLPKSMAPVAGQPFLSYVIDHYRKEGIEKFILAVGYRSSAIEEWINTCYTDRGIKFEFSLETEPLETGGAIRLACRLARDENILVLNGDTLFKVRLGPFTSFHEEHGSQTTLALKPMHNFDRYGTVELNEDGSVERFSEKKFQQSGYINGGVYLLRKDLFLAENLSEKFSFETDYLEKFFSQRKIFGFVQDQYFIDIGIPADYERAQAELVINNG